MSYNTSMANESLSAMRGALDKMLINTGGARQNIIDRVAIGFDPKGKAHMAYAKMLSDREESEKEEKEAQKELQRNKLAAQQYVSKLPVQSIYPSEAEQITSYSKQLNDAYDRSKLDDTTRKILYTSAIASRFPTLDRWREAYQAQGINDDETLKQLSSSAYNIVRRW